MSAHAAIYADTLSNSFYGVAQLIDVVSNKATSFKSMLNKDVLKSKDMTTVFIQSYHFLKLAYISLIFSFYIKYNYKNGFHLFTFTIKYSLNNSAFLH